MKLKKLLFVPLVYGLFLCFQSCELNTDNSFSSDSVCAGSKKYCNFVAILKKDTHGCFHCHASGGEAGDSWEKLATIEDWEHEGLVNQGDADGSEIIAILKPLGDMPRGNYTPIDTDEIQQIKDYINSL